MLSMMFWNYRDDNNCWDYVRYWLNKIYNVPLEKMPKYGMLPPQKDKMQEIREKFSSSFKPSDALNGSIVCAYRKRYLYHVGLIHDGKVYHVKKSRVGVNVDDIENFEKNSEIKFYAYKGL